MTITRRKIRLQQDTYLHYLFAKHHVAPGYHSASFEEVINSVVGVHSARLPTPYVAFGARMKGITPRDYRDATYRANRLIKLRCMRKTLHTVTPELAPIVHIATLELRTSEVKLRLRRLGFPLRLADELLQQMLDVVLKSPKSHNQVVMWIVRRISKDRPHLPRKRAIGIARLLLKWSWENGHLCYLNRAEHWSRELRFYGNTKILYPTIALDAHTKEQAILQLVLRYIRAFEPVSERDVAWWTGIRVSELRKAMKYLTPKLLEVALEGVADGLLMTPEGFQEYVRFQMQSKHTPWCAFLAYEDPTLKGYYDTRMRYVDLKNYTKLFNQIGEVRPSIHINGRAVGVWSWDAKKRRISTRFFRRLTENEKGKVVEKKQELEKFLDESYVT